MATGAGCRGPSAANIELRKQNAELREQVEALERRRPTDAATIAALESRAGAGATTAWLASDQLDRLVTPAGLRLGRLTGVVATQPSAAGIDAIRVQAVPVDAENEPIKVAGTFEVEAFDLTGSPEPRRVGQWTFDLAATRAAWRGQAMQYAYFLSCSLSPEAPPIGGELTVRVTFRDELTGRAFTQQTTIEAPRQPGR